MLAHQCSPNDVGDVFVDRHRPLADYLRRADVDIISGDPHHFFDATQTEQSRFTPTTRPADDGANLDEMLARATLEPDVYGDIHHLLAYAETDATIGKPPIIALGSVRDNGSFKSCPYIGCHTSGRRYLSMKRSDIGDISDFRILLITKQVLVRA